MSTIMHSWDCSGEGGNSVDIELAPGLYELAGIPLSDGVFKVARVIREPGSRLEVEEPVPTIFAVFGGPQLFRLSWGRGSASLRYAP